GGLCAVALVLAFMNVGYAQDSGDSFSDDEFSDFDDFGDFDEGDDFDDFDDFGEFDEDGDSDFDDFGDFGDDEFGESADFGLPTIAGLIVSSEALAPPLAEQLTQALEKELAELGLYEGVSN